MALHARVFQSALRMRGLFNGRGTRTRTRRCRVSIRLADAWPFQRAIAVARHPRRLGFQSALRMRGLFNGHRRRPDGRDPGRFNPPCGCVAFSTGPGGVGIVWRQGFNPPCGCVAFSTRAPVGHGVARARVSIRLADAWPFQLDHALRGLGYFLVSIRLADAWPFQPGRRWLLYATGMVSIRLADAWPFQP